MVDKNMEQRFEEWAGNKPVEFPDMDKDPMSFWCWKAWQKAAEIEREACASVCENQTEGFAATSTWDEAALSCARAIRARKVGAGTTARPPTPTGWSDTDWLKHLQEQQHPLAGLHINQGSMDAAADAYEAEYNARHNALGNRRDAGPIGGASGLTD